MSTHAQSMAARLSKFKVGDLAMRSALQLERARAGLPYDRNQLVALAEALRVSAGHEEQAGQVSYMRPGYFEPFERVYRSSHDDAPQSTDELRRFVIQSIQEIDSAAANDRIDEIAVAKLVDLCLELNREFIRRQPAENRVGRRQRSIPVEAFVR